MDPIQLTKLLTGVAIGSFFLSAGLVGMESGRGFVGELVGMVQLVKDTAAVQFNTAKQFLSPWSSYENPLDTPLIPRILLEQVAEETAKFYEEAEAFDTNNYVKQIQELVQPYETKFAEVTQGSAILWSQIQDTNGFFYQARIQTLQDRVQGAQQNLTEESLWSNLITEQQKLTPLQGVYLFRRVPKQLAEVPLTEYQWLTLEAFHQTQRNLQGRLQRFEQGEPLALVQEYIGVLRGTVFPEECEKPVPGDSERVLGLRTLLGTVEQIIRNYSDADTILAMQLQVEGGRYFFTGSAQEDIGLIDRALNKKWLAVLPKPLASYTRLSLYKLPLHLRISSASKELDGIHRSSLRVALEQHQRTRLQRFEDQRDLLRHMAGFSKEAGELEESLGRLEQESFVLPLTDFNFIPNWLRLLDQPKDFASLRDLRRFYQIAQAKRRVSWAALLMMGSLFMLFSTGFTAILFTILYLAIQIVISLGQTVLNMVKVGEGVTGYLANKAESLEQGAALQLEEKQSKHPRKKVHFLVEDADK